MLNFEDNHEMNPLLKKSLKESFKKTEFKEFLKLTE